jgi:Flp pilus assembly pilin Flp
MRRKEREDGLIEDERGVYQTEYTIVLVLVALAGSVAIGMLAIPLLSMAISLQDAIVFPVP